MKFHSVVIREVINRRRVVLMIYLLASRFRQLGEIVFERTARLFLGDAFVHALLKAPAKFAILDLASKTSGPSRADHTSSSPISLYAAICSRYG